MTDSRKKFILLFIPIIGVMVYSLITMIKSFGSNEPWRIIFSTVGFLMFFALTSLFAKSAAKKIKIEQG